MSAVYLQTWLASLAKETKYKSTKRHLAVIYRVTETIITCLIESEPEQTSKSKSTKPLKEIMCKECEEVFATKEMMSLHTCESLLDEHYQAEETQERSVKPRTFSLDTSLTMNR